jgi:hypothetical protein
LGNGVTFDVPVYTPPKDPYFFNMGMDPTNPTLATSNGEGMIEFSDIGVLKGLCGAFRMEGVGQQDAQQVQQLQEGEGGQHRDNNNSNNNWDGFVRREKFGEILKGLEEKGLVKIGVRKLENVSLKFFQKLRCPNDAWEI